MVEGRSVKIGLLSDSHGMTRRLSPALRQLKEAGAQAIVHCGDICSAQCMQQLGECGLPVYAVAGNMDRHASGIYEAARRHNICFAEDFVALPVGNGKHLAATHGHLSHMLEELILGEQFSYVCHGHTHRLRDERIGSARVINPGALRGPRGHHGPTFALLDTDTDELTVFELED
ncbi:MAG: metallophosphoesterase family protein [Phycisphaerae bacterium]